MESQQLWRAIERAVEQAEALEAAGRWDDAVELVSAALDSLEQRHGQEDFSLTVLRQARGQWRGSRLCSGRQLHWQASAWAVRRVPAPSGLA